MSVSNLRFIFNEALINEEFQLQLFANLQGNLEKYNIPEQEIEMIMRKFPQDMREFAQIMMCDIQEV